MASGDLLFHLPVGALHGPAANAAQFTSIAGASTPAERFLVAAFDSTTAEYLDSDLLVMPAHYSGGGVTIKFFTSTSTTAGGTDGYVFRVAFREIADDADDIDTTEHDYTDGTVGFRSTAEIQPPSAKGELSYDTAALTSGSQMDSVGAGDAFIMRVGRNVAHADDTLSEDVYLHAVAIYET